MRFVFVVCFLFLATSAGATECLRSASAVRGASPGSWPSWSQRVEGHRGVKCWFPSTKRRTHVAAKVMRRPPAKLDPRQDHHPRQEVVTAAPPQRLSGFNVMWSRMMDDITNNHAPKFVDSIDGLLMYQPWRSR